MKLLKIGLVVALLCALGGCVYGPAGYVRHDGYYDGPRYDYAPAYYGYEYAPRYYGYGYAHPSIGIGLRFRDHGRGRSHYSHGHHRSHDRGHHR